MDPKLLDRFTYLGFALLALVAVYLFKSQPPPPPPQVRPSVPSLIAPDCPGPKCAGTCNPARLRHGPFRVICPHCRTALDVQEPDTGATGPESEAIAEKVSP